MSTTDRLRPDQIAAPMSYAGSGGRILNATVRRPVADNPWVRFLLLWPTAVLLIFLAWILVTGWYLTFGLLVAPYRLLRRGQRKRKVEARRHAELVDAVKLSQLRNEADRHVHRS